MKAYEKPTTQQLKEELRRIRQKKAYSRTFRTAFSALLTIAAVIVLVTTLFFPVLQVTGTSMEPVLQSGQLVIAVKTTSFQRGDVIAFYYNNKVLLKRVIGFPGDDISLDTNGTVLLNGQKLIEPYLTVLSYGNSDISYPYHVPEGTYFVMGDHRETSQDSRLSSIGCISKEAVIGKIVFRIWPLQQFGGSGIDYRIQVEES